MASSHAQGLAHAEIERLHEAITSQTHVADAARAERQAARQSIDILTSERKQADTNHVAVRNY